MPDVTPMSLDFDYGDFSNPSKKFHDFNERQVELLDMLFANQKSITMPVIDSVAYRSEDFGRLWARFVEIHAGEESKAAKTLRGFINNRNIKKKKEEEAANNLSIL